MFRLNWFFTWTDAGGVLPPAATILPIMARHGRARPGIGTRGR